MTALPERPDTQAIPPLEVDLMVEAGAWPADLQVFADRALDAAMNHVQADFDGPAEISVLLTDDERQKALNLQWRGFDKSTNVLSFPASNETPPFSGLIGDISLAFETLAREAEEQAKSFTDHFCHLLVHGFLHCLGYDHENDADALVMERLETQILAQLHIDDPYD